MVHSYSLVIMLAVAMLGEAAVLSTPAHGTISSSLLSRQNKGGNGGGACLNKNLIQSNSDKTGQEPGTDGIKPGQAKSVTDPDNFINFCQGKTITNGAQITAGSCNGIPMGDIPALKNMVSAMITNPQPGEKVQAGQTFNISVQTSNLKAGNFVNPTTNYYTSPQALDDQGKIIGHCHVTVQDIGSLKSTTPPDPTKFAFFKGIDDAGNGKGLLQATVTGGLPAGTYRVCTMIAAQNHQPVAMPVAQRGAQDDCTKFEVVGNGNNNGANGNKNGANGAKDNNANKGDQAKAGKGSKKGGGKTGGAKKGGSKN
ncbi:fungal transcriptional regulatory protein [Colletotrichum truncatum]|uniref:Fungal transcriptional regulatory protein n=1 Tax=Colletotrichum truncatum TaxID=5467 RepID=A0ACC3YLR7_COLTU|nr:fungal transcriptional regulatory protein [Colletotrichum truncatum]KAF6791445.1 fungal transcriptional regulatory protein [Colletotrichum truncatum]